MKIFFIDHYNFVDLGIITIGRFYDAFSWKYVWNIDIKLLFWEINIHFCNRIID
jgi:hypothetical protein